MAIEVFNRYEKKYMLDEHTFRRLLERINDYMEPDKYNLNGQFYSICNIYYDTDDNRLIRSSIEKPVYKEKLRMRSYGTPCGEDKVFLEIKKKYNGIVNKRRTSIVLNISIWKVMCILRVTYNVLTHRCLKRLIILRKCIH